VLLVNIRAIEKLQMPIVFPVGECLVLFGDFSNTSYDMTQTRSKMYNEHFDL